MKKLGEQKKKPALLMACLLAAMGMILLPETAYATETVEFGTSSGGKVEYVEGSGGAVTEKEDGIYIERGGSYVLSGEFNTGIHVTADGEDVALTLNNVKIQAKDTAITAENVAALTISLVGDNVIEGDKDSYDYSISADEDITIMGDSLTTGYGIFSEAGITIQDGKIEVLDPSLGIVAADGNVVVENGDLTVAGGIYTDKGIIINGGTVLAENGNMSDESAQTSLSLLFKDPVDGKLTVSSEEGDILFESDELADMSSALVSCTALNDIETCLVYTGNDNEEMSRMAYYGEKEAVTSFALSAPVNTYSGIVPASDVLTINDLEGEAPYGKGYTWDAELVSESEPTWTLDSVSMGTENFTAAANASGDKVTVTALDTLNVGTYTDTLTVHYTASDGEEKEASCNVSFTVTKAANEWKTEPSILNWEEYHTAKIPKGTALFGDTVFTYSDKEDGTFTEAKPTTAGNWYMKAEVTGSDNYTELSAVVPFEITEHKVHTYKTTTEGNCLEGVIVIYTCRYCGHAYQMEHDPVDSHTYDEGVITAAATCVKDGNKHFTCSVCGDTYDEVIPATGNHTYEKEVTREADCTTDGIITYVCSVCQNLYTEAIPAIGHDYEAEVTKAPTCTGEGLMTYTCKHDHSHTYTKVIPDLGGHAWNNGVITTPVTCETDGVRTYTCTACGETYTEVLPAIGHDWDSGKVTDKATCTERGERVYTCKNDSSHTKTERIAARGHSWDDGRVTKAATCAEEGRITYYCKRDGSHVYFEAIPITDHDFDDGVITTTATCGKDGIRTFTCRSGGETYTKPIPATGNHTWVEAGTLENGMMLYRCDVCGDTKAEEVDAETVESEETAEEVDKGEESDIMDRDGNPVTTNYSDDDKSNATSDTEEGQSTSNNKLRVTVIIIYALGILGIVGIIYYVFKRQKKGY